MSRNNNWNKKNNTSVKSNTNNTNHEIKINKVTIPIKYKNENVPKLNKIQKGDWIDLYAAEDTFIPKGRCKLINLGIAMQLPKGYEAHLLPRSSTFKKWGIIMTNSTGIIDETYCGDEDWWCFSAYCLEAKEEGIYVDLDNDSKLYKFMTKHKPTRWIIEHWFKKTAEKHTYSVIHAGDKIAQFRIEKHMPNIEFKETSKLNNKNRGGFGSTGSK